MPTGLFSYWNELPTFTTTVSSVSTFNKRPESVWIKVSSIFPNSLHSTHQHFTPNLYLTQFETSSYPRVPLPLIFARSLAYLKYINAIMPNDIGWLSVMAAKYLRWTLLCKQFLFERLCTVCSGTSFHRAVKYRNVQLTGLVVDFRRFLQILSWDSSSARALTSTHDGIAVGYV